MTLPSAFPEPPILRTKATKTRQCFFFCFSCFGACLSIFCGGFDGKWYGYTVICWAIPVAIMILVAYAYSPYEAYQLKFWIFPFWEFRLLGVSMGKILFTLYWVFVDIFALLSARTFERVEEQHHAETTMLGRLFFGQKH